MLVLGDHKLQKTKKVIIIRSNTLERETRATKIIKSLSNNGFSIKFLGWNRGLKIPRSERSEAGNIDEEIYLNLKAPWGSTSLLFLPIWWVFIFIKLMKIEWDIAHAIQIISLPPVILAGKLRRKKVVYDILDTYEDSIMIPKMLRTFLIQIDKFFMRLADFIILADEEQIKEFNGIPNSNVHVIYDSPYDIKNSFHNHSPKKSKNDKFILFFAGLLYSGKKLNLDKIFDAVIGIRNVKIIIAGHGDMVNIIKDYKIKNPDKIEFIGEITHKEVLQRSYDSDLLFMLRDSLLPVNKYICGSKVLEAMMCGKPILVSSGTSTAHKVIKEKCGLVVDANNIENIRKAIIKLRDDPNLCKKMGSNARKAYEERYGWHIMEEKLINIFK